MHPSVRRALVALTTAVAGGATAAALASAPTTTATQPTVLPAAPAAPAAPATGADRAASPWVGTWAAAVTPAGASGVSATGFTDTTIRQVARVSVGGDRLRVRLSNVYGATPLALGRVTVATRNGGAGTPRVAPDTVRPVRFAGARTATVPVGADLVSDPVRMPVRADSDVVVSIHLPGPTGPATWHSAGYATSFTAPGDATGDRGASYARLDTSRYYLSGLDVAAPRGRQPRGSVVFFGDSITDGVVSTVDANRRYPDRVADRLAANRPAARRCGVLNVGISGNRLLTDAGAAGDSALARFDRDVLSRPGARSVVLLLGINDIGGSAGAVTPRELIAVHRQFVTRARDAGLRVVGATLTPYEGAGYYTEEGEADRQALNRWIRTSGAYDAVVDFDRALRDPADPGRIQERYDTGDALHPNDAGFARMARAVDLRAVC